MHDGSNNLAIYVDGDKKATATISGTPQVSSADDQNNSDGVLGIGKVEFYSSFNGKFLIYVYLREQFMQQTLLHLLEI